MAQYPTQSDSDTEQNSPCSNLVMLSGSLGIDKYNLYKSLDFTHPGFWTFDLSHGKSALYQLG